jgi:hypothetical protein
MEMTAADDRETAASRYIYRQITLSCFQRLQLEQSQVYQRNIITALLCSKITFCLTTTSIVLIKKRDIIECLKTS